MVKKGLKVNITSFPKMSQTPSHFIYLPGSIR